MRRLYIIIFICFCFSTEGQNEREKFAPEEITVETTNNHHNIDNDEEETPIAEIDQDVKNNEEKQDNQEDKSTENRFYYKNQDMHTPHTYKPFCVFRKYMETNHSFAFSRSKNFLQNGLLRLAINDFTMMGLRTVCYRLFSAAFGIGILCFIKYTLIPSIYLKCCISLLSLGGIDGIIYFLELLDFLILPYRREYIFFSYKNIKFLYKINYHVSGTVIRVPITYLGSKLSYRTINQNYEEQHPRAEGCTICLENFQENEKTLYHTQSNVEHIFHARCIKDWLNLHKTCPLCKANVYIEDQTEQYINVIKIIFFPELFVEFSSNTTRKYNVIFRLLVLSAGINLFLNIHDLNSIYELNEVNQNEVNQNEVNQINGQESQINELLKKICKRRIFCIPTVKCGGEIGITFSNTLEVLLFVHPQWLLPIGDTAEDFFTKNFVWEVGVSVRWLV